MSAQKLQADHSILYTDMYQLTMAQLYFRYGLHEKQAQFDHFFRSYPDYGNHKAGFCISAGLGWLLDWMQSVRIRDQDIDYLGSLQSSNGKRLFAKDFLDWLRANGHFQELTVHAIAEGRVVHPNVPLTVVTGPLAMAQIVETALLNMINYQTLIATKAARIREIGRGRMLLEFGMRRAQDGSANAGARAALIGGADFSSNVEASRMLGFDPKGTHAHSMVQVFMALGEGELEAFQAYADVYPDETLLLVDTIDTLESGIPNAIKVFEKLRQKGHEPVGIRLDLGDLAYLSIQAARMLNQAGFPDTQIVLSNQLDDLVIWQILTQIQDEAPRYGLVADEVINRLVFGVGTRLITSDGDAALDGVYKLVAVCEDDEWLPAIKISESRDKIINPGHKRVWRVYDRRGKATADLLSLGEEDPPTQDEITLHHPSDSAKYRIMPKAEIQEIEQLLEPVYQNGRLVKDPPDIESMRALREQDTQRLDPGVKRLMYPHLYHVSLTKRLWELKQELIKQALSS